MSLIGFILSVIVGPIIAGIGGLIACIGSSILVCCGPEKGKPGGDGKLQAGAVLMFIGGALEIVGAVVSIVLFFKWKADTEAGCELAYGSSYGYQPCVDVIVGFIGAFVWPFVGLAIATGVVELFAGFFCIQARTAMLSKGGTA